MALTKIKLGDLIYELNRRNTNLTYGIESVRGISNAKKIMSTKADVDTSVLHKFYIVNPGEFIYNPRTTRMGGKVGLAYNNTTEPLLFSFNNIAFAIRETAKELILGEYLYIFFNRDEFDRYAIKNSWGSATELFTFEEMCDIDFELPPIEIQRKYVEIYKGMIDNQVAYETGLEDLKLVCDGYIEDLRRKTSCEEIRPYIEYCSEKNSSLTVKKVCGVESSGQFMDTRAKLQGVDISNYTIIKKGYIAYNPSRINLGSIALYREDDYCVVSPMYEVFTVKESKKLIPEYLMMWLSREEFYRYTWFYSAGSVRDTFNYDLMEEVKIPIPAIEIQQAIVDIYNAYILRKEINEQLKQQIKIICPVLIKGAVEEAKRS